MIRFAVPVFIISLLIAAFTLPAQTDNNSGINYSAIPDMDEFLEALTSQDVPTVSRRKIEKPHVSTYDTILRNASSNAADSGLLQIDGQIIDPKEGLPKWKSASGAFSLPLELQPELDALNTNKLRLLQFDSPITPDISDMLEGKGLRVVGFVPNNAYLAIAPSDYNFTTIPGVRWQGAIPNWMKIDQTLRNSLGQYREDESILHVYVFDSVDPEPMLPLIAKLGAEVLVRNVTGPTRLTLRVPGDKLALVVQALARLEGVETISEFRVPVLNNYGSVWLLQSGNEDLQLTPLFDVGITGRGQIYGAADSGIDTDACQFRYSEDADAQTLANDTQPPNVNLTDPDKKIMSYYVLAGADAYDETSGYFHGTMTTGCATGDNYRNLADADNPGLDRSDGMAPAAKVVFQDIGTGTGYLIGLAFFTFFDIQGQAYDSGVRVHNNSYGYENPYTGYDRGSSDLDSFIFSHPDYSIFFSAGNSGPEAETLTGQGSTSKNTICVGASSAGWLDGGKDVVYFSSRGPTSDGRLKPDLMAPGIVESAVETGRERLGNLHNIYNRQAYVSKTDPPNNQCAVALTAGTSFSSPTAAGMALLVRQYYEDGFYPSGARNASDGFNPSSALVRATLINSTHNMEGDLVGYDGRQLSTMGAIEPAPSTWQGWGLIRLDDALYLKGDKRDLEMLADIETGSNDALTTDDVHEYEIMVKSGEPLKVTLAWTDPSASAYARVTLVNNLDLIVTDPNGKRYIGNLNFEDGVSKPSTSNTEADVVNNTEQVIIASPKNGTYTISVMGSAVPGNGMRDPDSRKQGYALIATGDIGLGSDSLGPHMSARVISIEGGCDNDSSLDKNETITIKLEAVNSGDGASPNLTAKVQPVADGSTVDTTLLRTVGDGRFDVGTVASRANKTFTLNVGLGNVEEDLCGKSATFEVRMEDSEGELFERMRFTIPLEVDSLDDGTQTCQTELCDPPAELTNVSPSKVFPGLQGIDLIIGGQNMDEGIGVTFDPDVIRYDELVVKSSQELSVENIVVAEDADLGPVIITLATADGAVSVYDDFLEVVEKPNPDGDETDGDESDPTDGDGITTESSGGCSQTHLPSLMLGLLLLAVIFLRRKVRE